MPPGDGRGVTGDDVSAAIARIPGADESRARALAWLRSQGDESEGFRVRLSADHPVEYVGPVSGTVDDVALLDPGAGPPETRVAFDRVYEAGERVPLAGTWAAVDPAAHVAEVSVRDGDAVTIVGRYPLRPGGTWTTGTDAAPAGTKVVGLVEVATGVVVAVAQSPAPAVAGVEVHVFSRTDIDNLQAIVPLRRDGTFHAPLARRGEKIARLIRSSDRRVVNSSEWGGSVGLRGLPRSFRIPLDDPDYGYLESEVPRRGYRLEQRSFTYDAALAALAFTQEGDLARAASILQRLRALQEPDGSLAFSHDVFLGRVADRYVRSGTLAWVGTAALEYERASGDTRFRPLATGLAGYLLGRQVTAANGYRADDPRHGSVLGGEGRYAAGYEYVPEEIAWASTEHNIDAYFFLRDLGYVVPADDRYARAARLVRRSLLVNHWNEARGRFDQGVGDPARALDLVSWGGLFLRAVGEHEKARRQLALLGDFRLDVNGVALSPDPESYNLTYHGPGPIGGYRPYAESPGTYDDPPEAVWAEGTWGALLLRLRLGADARADVEGMFRLQAADPAGGVLQVTRGRRSPPYEFHAWPAIGGTAWSVIVLGGSEILWRADGWAGSAASHDRLARGPAGPTARTGARRAPVRATRRAAKLARDRRRAVARPAPGDGAVTSLRPLRPGRR